MKPQTHEKSAVPPQRPYQEVGIMQIVNLFEDEENFDRLRACRTEQEVLDLIDRTNAAA